jgi:putative transposase
MAAPKKGSVIDTLTSCFPPEWIEETARETGAMKRKRVISIVDFFWTLVLGFSTGATRTIADLRRTMEQQTGVLLVPSSFYDRFTPELVVFLRKALERACQHLGASLKTLSGRLAPFKDLIITDATVIRLHSLLAKCFPAGADQAGVKVHVVTGLTGSKGLSVKLTAERVHESKVLRIGPWVKGALLLFDLGYYCYRAFDRIDANDGFFIARLKKKSKALVLAGLRSHCGRARELVGKTLGEVVQGLKRAVYDVQAQVSCKRRTYRGHQSITPRSFRVVGVWNAETGCYHQYITNIPPEMLSPEDVARTYAARWEVELMFKELKHYFRLDQIPSRKKHVVEALIYSALLSLCASRNLLNHLRKRLRLSLDRCPARRWAAVLHGVAHKILALLISPHATKLDLKLLEPFLYHELLDPNVKRSRNLELCWS